MDKGAVSPQAKLLSAIFGEGSSIKTEAGLKERLNSVLETLRPDERRVLRLRFGLDDGQSRTLEEVGREFGVTRNQIWQIEGKALRKLRHPSRSLKLRDYIQEEIQKIVADFEKKLNAVSKPPTKQKIEDIKRREQENE